MTLPAEHESKWTPGPWKAKRESVHAGCVATCRGHKKDGWFEVWSPNWSGGIDQEANANLISAAPDLYEALSSLIEALNTGTLREADDAKEAGVAALAKARGEG
jgi:hypothetical protein